MGLVSRVCQPSTLRMLIWPEASSAQNTMAAVSADGSTVCVDHVGVVGRRSPRATVRAHAPEGSCACGPRTATSISLLVVISVREDGQKVLLAIKKPGARQGASQSVFTLCRSLCPLRRDGARQQRAMVG